MNGKPFKCVSMVISDEHLREFYDGKPILNTYSENISNHRPIKKSPLLNGFFESLSNYFEMQDELPEELVPIKTKEVLTLIDKSDKRASSILGTFNGMGKIALKKIYGNAFHVYPTVRKICLFPSKKFCHFYT